MSTHYTNYNPWLFAINLSALILALIPKLPFVRPSSFLPLSGFKYRSRRPTGSASAS